MSDIEPIKRSPVEHDGYSPAIVSNTVQSERRSRGAIG